MISFFKKHWFLITLGFLATFLFFLRFLLSPSLQPPRVISLSPSPGKISSPPQEIKIELDRPIEKEVARFSLFSLPFLKTKKRAQKNILIFSLLEPLSEENRYFLELKYRGLPFYSWSYQLLPSPSPSPSPSLEKGSPQAREEIIKEIIQEYPLIRYLPYENDLFSLTYIAPLTLEVTPKIKNQEKVREAVFSWIKEKGIDPKTHQIRWQPTP